MRKNRSECTNFQRGRNSMQEQTSSLSHLKSQRPSAASALTHPVCSVQGNCQQCKHILIVNLNDPRLCHAGDFRGHSFKLAAPSVGQYIVLQLQEQQQHCAHTTLRRWQSAAAVVLKLQYDYVYELQHSVILLYDSIIVVIFEPPATQTTEISQTKERTLKVFIT